MDPRDIGERRTAWHSNSGVGALPAGHQIRPVRLSTTMVIVAHGRPGVTAFGSSEVDGRALLLPCWPSARVGVRSRKVASTNQR